MKELNRWIYAAIGVVVLLMAGLVYAWTIMAKSIGAHMGWGADQLSLTFTIVMAFFCIGCLLAGVWARKMSPRLFVIISSVLFLAGFMLSGTVASLSALYLGFGVLCGLGAGFSYNAVMSTISAWFPDRQGLVSGILLMGFGLSAFIVGKVFAAVAPADGTDTWMAVFRSMGIIIAVVMGLCSIFFVRPGKDFRPPAASSARVVREPASDVDSRVMLRNTSFWAYYVWAILVSGAGLALVSQGGGIATQVGAGQVSEGSIATAVGLISIFNGIGRVIFGTLFDRKGYRPTIIAVMLVFAAAGGIMIAAINAGSFVMLTAGFIVGGFAYGGVTPTNSAIISDFFGRTHYPMNFSLINTNLLIASLASAIAGALRVATGSYLSTIYLMLVLTAAGAAVFLFIRRPE